MDEKKVLNQLMKWLESSINDASEEYHKSALRHDGMETARLRTKHDSLIMVRDKVMKLKEKESEEERFDS